MYGFKKFLRLYNKLILPTIILIVCTFIVVYGVIPGAKSIQNLIIENQSLEKDIAGIKKRLTLLQNLDENTLRNSVAMLLSAVPSDKSIPSVISTVEAVSNQSGITINDFTLPRVGSISTASADLSTINEKRLLENSIPVKLTAAGKIEQITDFLNRIHSIRRLFRITTLDVSFAQDSISTSLEMDSFFAPLPKTLGKPSDPLTPLSANEEELLSKINNYPFVSEGLTEETSGTTVVTGVKADPFSP